MYVPSKYTRELSVIGPRTDSQSLVLVWWLNKGINTKYLYVTSSTAAAESWGNLRPKLGQFPKTVNSDPWET